MVQVTMTSAFEAQIVVPVSINGKAYSGLFYADLDIEFISDSVQLSNLLWDRMVSVLNEDGVEMFKADIRDMVSTGMVPKWSVLFGQIKKEAYSSMAVYEYTEENGQVFGEAI